jgi:flagellar hook-basal body complex protein FliE
MKVEGFSDLIANSIQVNKNTNVADGSFSNTFSDALKDVNQDQLDWQSTIKDFVSGNGVELHQVMIAGEKAKTSLELLMQVRNKALDMFKELTRIPI